MTSRTDKFLTMPGLVFWTSIFNAQTHEPTINGVAGKQLSTPSYNLHFAFPKTAPDAANCQNYLYFWQYVSEIVQKEFGGQIGGLTLPIKDGDEKAARSIDPQTGATKYPFLQGMWYFKASTNLLPVIVDQNGHEIDRSFVPAQGDKPIASGDTCTLSLDCWSYNNKQRGVNFGLEAVKLEAKGQPLGGGEDSTGGQSRQASEIFGAPTGQPATPASAPTMPGQAPQQAPFGGAPTGQVPASAPAAAQGMVPNGMGYAQNAGAAPAPTGAPSVPAAMGSAPAPSYAQAPATPTPMAAPAQPTGHAPAMPQPSLAPAQPAVGNAAPTTQMAATHPGAAMPVAGTPASAPAYPTSAAPGGFQAPAMPPVGTA